MKKNIFHKKGICFSEEKCFPEENILFLLKSFKFSKILSIFYIFKFFSIKTFPLFQFKYHFSYFNSHFSHFNFNFNLLFLIILINFLTSQFPFNIPCFDFLFSFSFFFLLFPSFSIYFIFPYFIFYLLSHFTTYINALEI